MLMSIKYFFIEYIMLALLLKKRPPIYLCYTFSELSISCWFLIKNFHHGYWLNVTFFLISSDHKNVEMMKDIHTLLCYLPPHRSNIFYIFIYVFILLNHNSINQKSFPHSLLIISRRRKQKVSFDGDGSGDKKVKVMCRRKSRALTFFMPCLKCFLIEVRI